MDAILKFPNTLSKHLRLEFQFYRKSAISISQSQDFRSVRHYELLFCIQSRSVIQKRANLGAGIFSRIYVLS